MKVLFINNDGAGFAGDVGVAEGTTIADFFASNMRGADASSCLIKVNREAVKGSYVLVDGDRVTVTPTKIEGN